MERQEKYNALIARMMLPENFERRNPQILSNTDIMIAEFVADMEKHLASLSNESDVKRVFIQKQFDSKYEKIINILDEQGWA